MLKTMHDKKTYLAYIHKQFVLPKSLRKREQRMLVLFEDHLSKYTTTKRMHSSTRRTISILTRQDADILIQMLLQQCSRRVY